MLEELLTTLELSDELETTDDELDLTELDTTDEELDLIELELTEELDAGHAPPVTP